MSENVHPEEVLGKIADAFGEENYALIGGLAVTVRGIARTTRYVDLLLAVPRIRVPGVMERFQEARFSMNPEKVLIELRDHHFSQIHYGPIRVDLLGAVLDVFQEIVRKACWEKIHGHRIRIASAEGLILLKLLAFRQHDLGDLWGLVAANKDTLNLKYLRSQYRQVGKMTDLCWQTFENILNEKDKR